MINCNFYHKVLILVKRESFPKEKKNHASCLRKNCIFKRILLLFSTFKQKSTDFLKFQPSLLEKIKAQENYLPHYNSNDKI